MLLDWSRMNTSSDGLCSHTKLFVFSLPSFLPRTLTPQLKLALKVDWVDFGIHNNFDPKLQLRVWISSIGHIFYVILNQKHGTHDVEKGSNRSDADAELTLRNRYTGVLLFYLLNFSKELYLWLCPKVSSVISQILPCLFSLCLVSPKLLPGCSFQPSRRYCRP